MACFPVLERVEAAVSVVSAIVSTDSIGLVGPVIVKGPLGGVFFASWVFECFVEGLLKGVWPAREVCYLTGSQ